MEDIEARAEAGLAAFEQDEGLADEAMEGVEHQEEQAPERLEARQAEAGGMQRVNHVVRSSPPEAVKRARSPSRQESPPRRAPSRATASPARSSKMALSMPPNATKAKPYPRANYSFSNARLQQIDADNQKLVNRLESIARQPASWPKETGKAQPPVATSSTATVNRRKAALAIAMENEFIYQRLIAIRPDRMLDRQRLAKEHASNEEYWERRNRIREAQYLATTGRHSPQRNRSPGKTDWNGHLTA